jgi:hypothetical protein
VERVDVNRMWPVVTGGLFVMVAAMILVSIGRRRQVSPKR